MSCSPKFMGLKPTGSPEKSSFTQTCTLLSQYLKEKGSFGDLTLGMTCNGETKGNTEMLLRPCSTMDLFPVNEKSGDDYGMFRKSRSMDLFPNQAGFPGQERVDSSVTTVNKRTPAAAEPQAAQMTIFYGGQVIVFNDFPAEKAKEIMLLAGKGSSQSNRQLNSPFTCSTARTPVEPGIGVHPTSNFGNTGTQDCVRSAHRPIPGGDLPIARRASLHRFLEKRKDRVTTRAPYQIGTPAASTSKPADNKSWLGLAAQSLQ